MTIQYMQVVASSSPEEVADFIKCLYVAVAGLSSDQVSKKLVTDMQKWLPKARHVENELGIQILSDIQAFGKGAYLDEDKFAMLAKTLRIAFKAGEIQKDPHIPQNYVDMLMSATTYLINRSPGKLNSIIRLSSDLEEPDITQAFVVEASDQKSFVKPLKAIVKAATGKDGTVLTAEQIKMLKTKYPKLHKQYLGLRKDFNVSWRTAMRNYVYESGKKVLPYDKVVGFLEGQGLQHTLPQGFVGLIDGNGKIYTTAGKAIKTMPGPGFSAVMNPDYDPKLDNQYVFTTVTPEGRRSQHVYTTTYSKKKTEEKFAKVHALQEVLDRVHKKWLPFIKRSTKEPQSVASTMLELLFEYSARIGSMGNATGGQSTQGLSTLMVKQMKVTGNSVTLRYPGKDAVTQTHVLDGSSALSKLLVKNLKMYAQGKAPNDFLFTYEWNGKETRMTGNMVNKWFAKMGAPAGVTVHKLRHVKGSEIFEELLRENEDKIFKSKKPLTQAQADAVIKALATQVGQQLGHVRGIGKQQKVTPSTAIQNYIDPALMIGVYTRLGLRPPKFLAKFLG
jgi:hypothetical protein